MNFLKILFSFTSIQFIKTLKITKNIYNPKTENQKKYIELLNNNSEFVITVIGPAGTGKTFLACLTAINKLKENKIDKIIITRPVISVEEDIGFLPGNIEKKMEPWTKPIFDVFLEFYTKLEINNMLSTGKIEISPLGFMRGRTFTNSFIIADEMQNSTPNQMLMLLTRLGINSKAVINGDLYQSDRIKNNGLLDLHNKLVNSNKNKLFHLIEFNNNDIQRSEIVKNILELYDINNDAALIANKKHSKLLNNDAALIPNKDYSKLLNNDAALIANKKNSKLLNNDAALIPIKDYSKLLNNDAALIPIKDYSKLLNNDAALLANKNNSKNFLI